MALSLALAFVLTTTACVRSIPLKSHDCRLEVSSYSLSLAPGATASVLCIATCPAHLDWGRGLHDSLQVRWRDGQGKLIRLVDDNVLAVTSQQGLGSSLVFLEANAEMSATYTCTLHQDGRALTSTDIPVFVHVQDWEGADNQAESRAVRSAEFVPLEPSRTEREQLGVLRHVRFRRDTGDASTTTLEPTTIAVPGTSDTSTDPPANDPSALTSTTTDTTTTIDDTTIIDTSTFPTTPSTTTDTTPRIFTTTTTDTTPNIFTTTTTTDTIDTTPSPSTTSTTSTTTTTDTTTTTTQPDPEPQPQCKCEESTFGSRGVVAFAVTLAVAVIITYSLLMFICLPRCCSKVGRLNINGAGNQDKARYTKETPPMLLLPAEDQDYSTEVKEEQEPTTVTSESTTEVKEVDEQPESQVSSFLLRQRSLSQDGGQVNASGQGHTAPDSDASKPDGGEEKNKGDNSGSQDEGVWNAVSDSVNPEETKEPSSMTLTLSDDLLPPPPANADKGQGHVDSVEV